jgi:hypothetical protein
VSRGHTNWNTGAEVELEIPPLAVATTTGAAGVVCVRFAGVLHVMLLGLSKAISAHRTPPSDTHMTSSLFSPSHRPPSLITVVAPIGADAGSTDVTTGVGVVGDAVGIALGELVGLAVVGCAVGTALGAVLGLELGTLVGGIEGDAVGHAVGVDVDGTAVGASVGAPVGRAVVGRPVGAVGVGTGDGCGVGAPVGAYWATNVKATPPNTTVLSLVKSASMHGECRMNVANDGLVRFAVRLPLRYRTWVWLSRSCELVYMKKWSNPLSVTKRVSVTLRPRQPP